MIIDMRSGWLDFVIISSGGIIGLGSKSRAVPTTAVSPATAIHRTLALDIALDRWRNAPTFSKGQFTGLSNPAQVRQIYKYYGQPWPAGEDPALPPTGREVGATRSPEMASDLIRKNVVNPQGQEMGNIVDLLVSLKRPNVTFVVLKPAFFITSADQSVNNQLFAVPVYAFNSSQKHKKLVLDATPREFRQAPPLNADAWRMKAPAKGNPRIFRYQATETANTYGVVSDRMSLNRAITVNINS